MLAAEAADNRHAATSSEPHTQAPAAGFPQYRMIDVPPSDYLTKPLANDKVTDHISAAATDVHTPTPDDSYQSIIF